MYRYIVSFIPINNKKNSDKKIESRDFAFYLDSENIYDIKDKAYSVAQDKMDPYSLRNHWEIKTIKQF